ncbi:hypothetical protein [Candidatus Uabimicrobium amorphum]|uniref:Uncharacterized protein n=1 Tax=Uabimicrobium amorphum TaxID=2596890 RepID=A0A5S9IKJ2_UABAM|nr:hypothetical protein [Candidatus Uabimicrobium amorphum]BBM83394.1 hypothetical protein UABAM_01746 [Candidatus Uabimicrobium amorphum]
MKKLSFVLAAVTIFMTCFCNFTQAQEIKIPWELGKTYRFCSVVYGKKAGNSQFTVKSFQDDVYTIEVVTQGGFESKTTYKISKYGEPLSYSIESDYISATATFNEKEITHGVKGQQAQTIERHKNLLLFDSLTILPSLNIISQEKQKSIMVQVYSAAMNKLTPLTSVGPEVIDYNGKKVNCWKYTIETSWSSQFGPDRLWFDEKGFLLRRETDIFTLEWVQDEQHEASLEDPALYDKYFPPVKMAGSLDFCLVDKEVTEKESENCKLVQKKAGKVLEDYQKKWASKNCTWVHQQEDRWLALRTDEKVSLDVGNTDFREDPNNFGAIQFTITNEKVKEQFTAFTKKHMRKQVAVVRKGKILFVMYINSVIEGTGMFQGVKREDLENN